MYSYTKNQINISLLIFITINVLFYFKYIYRISFLLSIIAVILYVICCLTITFNWKKIPVVSKPKLLIGIGTFFIFCFAILFFIPKETLNVDRWLMIELFWDTMLKGNYPYGVASEAGNYPGPMPFYFILCYPFYAIDEIGLLTLVSIAGLFYYFYKKYDYKLFLYTVFLVVSSLAVYYEIFVRSTILFNSLLFFIFIDYLKDFKSFSPKQFYLTAFAGGLLLSIRSSFVMVMVIWGMYMLVRERVKFTTLFKWGIVYLLSFSLTFLPFIIMSFDEFLMMNPFIIQSSFLIPFSFTVFFIILSFLIVIFCKKYTDVIFFSAVIFFAVVTVHVIYTVYNGGINSFLTSGTDISYYLFCFPFLLDIITNKVYDK